MSDVFLDLRILLRVCVLSSRERIAGNKSSVSVTDLRYSMVTPSCSNNISNDEKTIEISS